jgi:hypothetical protein
MTGRGVSQWRGEREALVEANGHVSEQTSTATETAGQSVVVLVSWGRGARCRTDMSE